MPNLAAYHPEVVHFVVALLFVGVFLRLVSLSGWFSFANPAAATLILLGTLASVAAVRSGQDAHGPVERVPGSYAAVVDHEEWGERARNLFLGISGLELIALTLWALGSRRARLAAGLSAIAGLVGLFAVYEAAEHGGELVYGYAGGVGIRFRRFRRHRKIARRRHLPSGWGRPSGRKARERRRAHRDHGAPLS